MIDLNKNIYLQVFVLVYVITIFATFLFHVIDFVLKLDVSYFDDCTTVKPVQTTTSIRRLLV